MALLFLYNRIDCLEMSFKHFILYLVGGVLGLLVGSRILFVIGILPSIEKISLSVIGHYLLQGGIVFYGGMLGLLFGIFVVAKCRKESPCVMLNFISPAIPLFHGFARLGCLFSGCCYGIPCGWGVRMLQSPDIVRFPVQLLESICDFLIFIGIYIYQKKSKDGNHALEIYLCAYAICRFVLEFFRGDTVRGLWMFGISTSQIISVLILLVLLVVNCKRKFSCKNH